MSKRILTQNMGATEEPRAMLFAMYLLWIWLTACMATGSICNMASLMVTFRLNTLDTLQCEFGLL